LGVPKQNTRPATAKEIGLSRKEIHEARQIRDAEKRDPGIVRRTVNAANRFIAVFGNVILEATAKTGGQMTEPTEKNELIIYKNVDTAPFVYFDISPTHGTLSGAIQIELAARILNTALDGSVEIKFITTGRLRCSPAAALNLRNAIDAALKMLEQPQQAPAASAKLN
jgi:hypothetical protein